MILLADANDDDEVPVGEYAEKEKERLEASWRSWGQDVPPGSPIHRLPSSFFEYYYEDDDDGDHDVDDGVHLASTHSVLLLPLWKDPTCIFAPWGNPLRFFSISSYDEHRLKMSQKNKAHCAFPSQELGDVSNKKDKLPLNFSSWGWYCIKTGVAPCNLCVVHPSVVYRWNDDDDDCNVQENQCDDTDDDDDDSSDAM